jgi:superfamily I DNA and/or RNA helicase
VEKLVLIGDEKQQHPHVENIDSMAAHMDLSLFERLTFLGTPHFFLDTQYRCPHVAGNICSRLFYNRKLKNGYRYGASDYFS